MGQGAWSDGIGAENAERPTSNIERRSEPRKRLRLTRLIFLEMGKANFVATREIVIEFVFSLCENGFVPGSVTRPTGRIQ
jgi:hypothetical protein